MKSKTFGLLVVFLAVFGLIFPWQSQAEESEPLTITHSVQTYTNDGPTMTVTLSLDVQNFGSTSMGDINIILAPLPKVPLSPIEERVEEESVPIGTLGAGQTTTAAYTLTRHIIYPQDVIASRSIFWKISYLDEASQEVTTIVKSSGATQ